MFQITLRSWKTDKDLKSSEIRMDIYFLGKWNSVWLFEEGKKKNLKKEQKIAMKPKEIVTNFIKYTVLKYVEG